MRRALIVHENGVEYLVVESALDAEGQAFRRIFPAEPTVAPATHGPLDVLDHATRAVAVLGEPGGVGGIVSPVLLFLALIGVPLVFGFTPRAARWLAVVAPAAVVLSVVVASMLAPRGTERSVAVVS